jgi:agmatinase
MTGGIMMRFDEAYSGKVFIASQPTHEDAKGVLYGMPMDWTVSFRPGSRFGPARIREVSLGLEEYSPYLDGDIADAKLFDAGDIPLPFGNAQKSLDMIEEYVDSLLTAGKFPLGMGGEHLVTWPVVKAFDKHYDDFVVLHFDAHTDLRDSYEGEPLSHSTPLKKIANLIGPENCYSFGIRSGMKEEFEWAKTSGYNLFKYEIVEPLKAVLPKLAGKKVYVTIDIDVLDPSAAPGTGTQEIGGVTTKELLEVVHMIARADVDVIGADLVEVCPAYDQSDMTAIAAAKVLREMMIGFIK